MSDGYVVPFVEGPRLGSFRAHIRQPRWFEPRPEDRRPEPSAVSPESAADVLADLLDAVRRASGVTCLVCGRSSLCAWAEPPGKTLLTAEGLWAPFNQDRGT